MKAAISLPNDLFDEVEECAKRLRLSRSGLIARAAREFVAKYRTTKDATRAWNEAIARGGQPGEDAAAKAMNRRSKAIIRKNR